MRAFAIPGEPPGDGLLAHPWRMRVNQVLLIDDENATRLVMTSRLLQAGYEVAAADNGALGINLAR